MNYKVIYIDCNFIDKRYPNSPEDGDRFFTYGFGSRLSREFKKYFPDIDVECWKTDSRISERKEKILHNIKHIVFPAFKIPHLGDYSTGLLKYLKSEVKLNKIIINISNFRTILFYSISGFCKNIPLVVQNHGESTVIYKAKIKKRFKKLFYNILKPVERKSFKNISHLFILDDRLKEYLPDTINQNNVTTQTLGVDTDMFKPIEKQKAQDLLNLNTNKKYIIYVGRLNDTKRADILIDVYNSIKKKKTDIQLIIAGCEKDDKYYDDAKDSKAILFGVILNTELHKYLSAANVYVLPNYSDNHKFGGPGLLTLESLLCNTPVVGGSLRAVSKEIRNKFGILADDKEDIENAIIEIIDEKKSFSNLRETAIENFSWQRISEKTKNIYDNLISLYETGKADY